MPAKIIQRNKKPMKKVKVDSVTIDIIESALRNARYEMDTVLFRTAMSPGIREQHEAVGQVADHSLDDHEAGSQHQGEHEPTRVPRARGTVVVAHPKPSCTWRSVSSKTCRTWVSLRR